MRRRAMERPDMAPAPATLSRKLLSIARDYLEARKRSGDAFLAAARNSQAAALRAAAAITMALAGDATRLALSQAETAARILDAEGYSSIASFLRLLVAPDDRAAAAPELTIAAAAIDIA